MDLNYAIRLPVPVEEAWAMLSDVPRVAACVPGAALESASGDEATGAMAVKVGPVMVRYLGTLTVQAQDPAAHTATLMAKGSEAHGDGDAAAIVGISLAADGEATLVSFDVALEVTGRIARFGRSVLSDVGERLAGKLATGLGGELVEVPVVVASAASASIPPPPGAPGGADIPPPPGAPGAVEAIEVVEVEMVETALEDPFDAVAPDDADLEVTPSIDEAEPRWAAADPERSWEEPEPEADVEPGPEPEPAPDAVIVAPTAAGPNGAGTATVARPADPTPSVARKVGPVLAGIAVLWLLKKLLTRSKP